MKTRELLNDEKTRQIKCEEGEEKIFENLLKFGSICLDMLNVKTKFFEAKPSDEGVIQKMTYYANTGIDALEKATPLEVPAKRKVQAYFVLAQLYRTFFTPSIDDQMKHNKKAIDTFTVVIVYIRMIWMNHIYH